MHARKKAVQVSCQECGRRRAATREQCVQAAKGSAAVAHHLHPPPHQKHAQRQCSAGRSCSSAKCFMGEELERRKRGYASLQACTEKQVECSCPKNRRFKNITGNEQAGVQRQRKASCCTENACHPTVQLSPKPTHCLITTV